MESFSTLNRKFTIKCYSKSFQKNIIDKFIKDYVKNNNSYD